MKKIPLTQGKYALVDDEDYDYLNQWKWYAAKGNSTYYAFRGTKTKKGQRTVRMHRVIMNTSKRQEVDHIDHNGLNNQRSNLRNCTFKQNQANKIKKKNCYSKYKGVYWFNKVKKWASYIRINGVLKYLGTFSSEIEAAKTYNNEAKKTQGEFACLNLIPKEKVK